jgi:hypothetical protein
VGDVCCLGSGDGAGDRAKPADCVQWPGYSGLSTVEWLFTPHTDDTTFVSITETGFTGDGDSLVEQVTASTQGFTLVLAGLKALLEHTIRLNLVADRYPKGLEEH